MIQISNLTKEVRTKRPTVNIDNYLINQGDMLGLVGNNGAGKTTTIKIMTGLLEAEEGRITINGMNARFDLGKLKSMIGYVPDFFGVYDNKKETPNTYDLYVQNLGCTSRDVEPSGPT